MFTEHDLHVLLVSALFLLIIMIDYVKLPKQHRAKMTRDEIMRAIERLLS